MSQLYVILVIAAIIILAIPVVVENIKGRGNISSIGLLTLIYLILFITVTGACYSFLEIVTSTDITTSQFDKWEKALEVAAAFTGFISLIMGFKIWQDGIERQQELNNRQSDLEIFNLFMKFRIDFDLIRRQAWKVRLKWRNSVYREVSIKYYFDSSILDENEEIIVEGKSVSIQTLKNELRSVRDIFEFYSALVVYKERAEKLVFHRLFFYDWWRPFLYDFAEQCDKHYDFPDSIKNSNNFDYQNYKLKKSYTKVMQDLDEIFGFVGLEKSLDFIKLEELANKAN